MSNRSFENCMTKYKTKWAQQNCATSKNTNQSKTILVQRIGNLIGKHMQEYFLYFLLVIYIFLVSYLNYFVVILEKQYFSLFKNKSERTQLLIWMNELIGITQDCRGSVADCRKKGHDLSRYCCYNGCWSNYCYCVESRYSSIARVYWQAQPCYTPVMISLLIKYQPKTMHCHNWKKKTQNWKTSF